MKGEGLIYEERTIARRAVLMREVRASSDPSTVKRAAGAGLLT